jgi:threonyl-tRNA synthetase
MDMPLLTKRHSLSHIMAHAIMELYPDAQFAIGPAIDTGWYYDIDFISEKPTEDDFKKIEKRMAELVKSNLPFIRTEKSIEEALEWAKSANQYYKVEIIEDLAKQGETVVSFYKVGKFEDLCRGPHVEVTGQIKNGSYKLHSVAGAYWRGDEKNKMLTRIYGLAFDTKEDLENHLTMLSEADKRDHRKLGRELDLFTFSELVGPGLPLWTPKGMVMRELLDNFVWELRQAAGYEKVEIPHITRKELYETSGHWEKFQDGLFTIETREGHFFAMKPMNCPHHTQIYKRRKWSYRELPQRYANTTMVYRDEQTGELSGLSRVRSITQDDAHVFCRPDQVKEEMLKIWHIITAFYSVVGFSLRIRLSCHDPKNMDAYLGDPALWKQAEAELAEMIKDQGQEPEIDIGEAAFYGPKVDFMANDSLGREWQVATIQLDMNLPQRFDLTYVSPEGKDEQVVMIHAAIMGSIERYMAILIEHYAGAFPVWLSPVQVKLLSVGEGHIDFCENLAREMKDKNIRVEVDTSSETVGNKIRKSVQEKIPYMLVIGDKEMGSDKLFVRKRGEREAEEWDKEKFIEEVNARKYYL